MGIQRGFPQKAMLAALGMSDSRAKTWQWEIEAPLWEGVIDREALRALFEGEKGGLLWREGQRKLNQDLCFHLQALGSQGCG